MARNSNREQGPQSAGPRELSCDSEAFKSVEFLPQGDTINAVSYLQTLYNLRDAPHDKCPAKKKIMLQHNNARHHIVRLQGDRVQTNGRNVSTRRSGPSFHGLSSYARTAMCDRWGGPGRVVGYKLLNRSSTVTQGGRKHLRHFVLGQWTECTDLTAIRRFLYSYIMSNGLMSSTSCREGVCVCVCVCVCGINHAMRMPRIIPSSVVCPALQYFSTLSHKGYDFRKKKLLNTECVFWFFLQLLSKTFHILRRTQRDIIYHNSTAVFTSCKAPANLVRFSWNLSFLKRFSKNTEISHFMKIRSVEVELSRANRQTDRQTWLS